MQGFLRKEQNLQKAHHDIHKFLRLMVSCSLVFEHSKNITPEINIRTKEHVD